MSSVREFWEFWEFWDLTLSRAISAGHAAEETRKHVREVVQSQSTTNFHKINEIRKHCHQAPNEKYKKILINVNFAMNPILEENAKQIESLV